MTVYDELPSFFTLVVVLFSLNVASEIVSLGGQSHPTLPRLSFSFFFFFLFGSDEENSLSLFQILFGLSFSSIRSSITFTCPKLV